MPDAIKQVIADMVNLDVTIREADYSKCGYHLEIQIDKFRIRELVTMFQEKKFYLVFVSAVHVLPTTEIIYQFAHFERLCRINCRVKVDACGTMSTISDIFQGANWHEREVKDMFGISFTGHPNLIPLIISEDDVDLKPLLKNDETLKSSEDVRWKATE